MHGGLNCVLYLLVCRYANDQNAFFADYAGVHKRLSELGSTWAFGSGLRLGPASKL
jgi:hypothetical protein